MVRQKCSSIRRSYLGRCVSSMQFPRSVDDSNFTQMTNKNKNDDLNEILELRLATLKEELEPNNPELYGVFDDLYHEIDN